MTTTDKEHLEWIRDRLMNVHKENPNFDHMQRLQEIIDNFPEEDKGIFITDKDGFKIFYEFKRFKAIKGEVKLEASTELEVWELIKRYNAEIRRFKPIEVIQVNNSIKGRLTSRVADSDQEVFFSFAIGEEKKHTKERLTGYSWETRGEAAKQLPYFVEATPKNMLILADIQKEQEAIEACERAINQLKKKYEKPVTLQTMEKAIGDKSA